MNPKVKDRGRDNVMPCQRYGIPQNVMMSMEQWRNNNEQGKTEETQSESCSSAILSTMNPTLPPGIEPKAPR
jgi:hypothetical protein